MGNWYLVHFKNCLELGTKRILAKSYEEAREEFRKDWPDAVIQLIEIEHKEA